MTDELKPLSKKHQRVLDEYLICFIQWRAYKVVYRKSSDEVARTLASRLFANKDFKANLNARLEKETIELKQRKPNRVASYVYLIRAENGLVKIGKSNDVYGRLKTLDTASPIKLELIFYIETNLADGLEEILHGIYESKRIKGEWFSLSENDISEIVERYGSKQKTS